MNWEPAEKIARAVLYEGYLLYPYRNSALKNRKRWMFGSIDPGGAAATEFLFEGGPASRLTVKVRFLQDLGTSLEERELLVENAGDARERSFAFPPLQGVFDGRAESSGEGLRKASLRVENRSPDPVPLLSCHAILKVEGGAFVSMTDPRSAVCGRRGLWPILVGDASRRDLLLAAPIILPDYPAIAPESPGDLFDGTEIDEILSLRILTMSDEEKEEVRRGDARGRRILERTEGLSPGQLLALHGTARRPFRAGDPVRLRPRGRADIMDLALEGKEATVVSVEEDLDGRTYLAVTVDDDPGRDLGGRGFPGHRFFFSPEEVEPR